MAEGDSRGVENGEEDKEKGSFLLPEMFGGIGGAPAADAKGAKGKAPPPKADPKAKGAKGAPVGGGVD
jgi:hypothetical protein